MATKWLQSLQNHILHMIAFQEERKGREPKFLLTKNRTTIDPAILLLGIYLKKIENTNFKRYMHPSVSSSIIYNCQGIKQPKCPLTNKWIKEMWHIEYCSTIKKNAILPFTTRWMDLKGILLSEISQTKKDK